MGATAGVLVLSAAVGAALYRKFCWYKSLQTINFDNPVYRKTVENGGGGGGVSGTATPSACSRSIAGESTSHTYWGRTLTETPCPQRK